MYGASPCAPFDHLLPGTTTWVGPGRYTACVAVERFFDDEETDGLVMELRAELSNQLTRHLDRPNGARIDFSEVDVTMRWHDTELVGVFTLSLGAVRSPKNRATGSAADQALRMFLEGKRLKLEGNLEDAILIFQRLREQYALTTFARRALREIHDCRSRMKRREVERP